MQVLCHREAKSEMFSHFSLQSASGNNNDSSDKDDPSTPPRRLIEGEVMTSKTTMRETVKSVIAPSTLQGTIEMLKNKKAQQKRVQNKSGEVLTTEDVKKRLRLEEIERKAKTKAKKTKS